MRRITVCTGKLHRVRVTGADLDYEGSITLDPVLMAAAGIQLYQMVHINGLDGGAHWETYALSGEPGAGEVILNGPPAHLFRVGELVIVLALASVDALGPIAIPRVVQVDELNRPRP